MIGGSSSAVSAAKRLSLSSCSAVSAQVSSQQSDGDAMETCKQQSRALCEWVRLQQVRLEHVLQQCSGAAAQLVACNSLHGD
jgi:hypothetical protein